jgi:hypothetical protein
MFRRYLFLGLTLMLGTVLVYLVIESRRSEQTAAKMRNTELVLQSPASATRAVAPDDLTVDGCRIRLTPAADTRGKSNGAVDIDIRNSGPAAYHNFMVRIALFGSSNQLIETRQRLLRESLAPGATLSAALIPLEKVPNATTGCKAEVIYAEVQPGAETATK